MPKLTISIILISLFTFPVNAGWDKVKKKSFNKLESTINKNLDNTEVTITSTERNKPKFEIITVQPLAEEENNITFFQGSAIRSDGDRETVNLGLGHRIFINDDLTMLGINGFYDHELDYDHKRTSIGAEIRSSAYEFNSNSYFAGSNSRTGKNNIAEESLDGFESTPIRWMFRGRRVRDVARNMNGAPGDGGSGTSFPFPHAV